MDIKGIKETKDTEGIKGQKLRKAGFEKLRIWQEAHSLMLVVHKIANSLTEREFEKAKQMKRSSSSVPDNIAEGYTTFYFNDKIKGMHVARKEAGETQNHLLALASKGLIDQRLADNLVSRYEGLIIGINRYIKYIAEKRDKLKKKS